MPSTHTPFAQELLPELVAWRRHLHQHPELGLQEHETTRFVTDLLSRWDVPFRTATPTGVIAELRGRRPGPTVALRCDLDALPILEETDLPFASQNSGVMHACGHDGHTAILLGTVRRFLDLAGDFPGAVRFLFQPGEEGHGGACKLMDQGALTGVKAIYGLHLWSQIESGRAEITHGPMMAAADRFEVRVFGRGGHGAVPQQTVDAIVVAAQIVQALQTIVARRIDPLRPGVVTVGAFQAGSASNVIADTATLHGTARSFQPEVRDLIERSIQDIADSICRAAGARAEVSYRRGTAALVNHQQASLTLRAAAERVLGSEHVSTMEPVMAGEDFAQYLEAVPGAFIFVGAKTGGAYPHHHPKFDIQEAPLASGVAILTEVALSELASD